ncbi:MAG: LuxR C-terminal-related transcriptional regulator [Gemmatimonadales bacterium]|nr:LuxR C-terminal-related transcriptional regulator [Gemmatimonadales bacterium]
MPTSHAHHQLALPTALQQAHSRGSGAEREVAAQAFVAAVLSATADKPTPRELEVAYLKVIEGLTYREISARLSVSLKTAEAHWTNLVSKAESTSNALRHRLLAEYWWQAGWTAARTGDAGARP